MVRHNYAKFIEIAWLGLKNEKMNSFFIVL